MNLSDAITYLEAAYPNWKPTAETPAVWADLLGHLEPRVLGTAVRAYVAEGHEFAPNPGQILQRAGGAPPDPLEAWGEVQNMVRVWHGSSHVPVWSHPLIERAVKALGGFKLLERELGESTRASFRARFVDCMKNLPGCDHRQDAYELAKASADSVLRLEDGGEGPRRLFGGGG